MTEFEKAWLEHVEFMAPEPVYFGSFLAGFQAGVRLTATDSAETEVDIVELERSIYRFMDRILEKKGYTPYPDGPQNAQEPQGRPKE